MEGFLNIRLRPWLRRLITRLHRHRAGGHRHRALRRARHRTAAHPEPGRSSACSCPFAVFPLVAFTSDPKKMGEFANPAWVKALAWAVAVIIGA